MAQWGSQMRRGISLSTFAHTNARSKPRRSAAEVMEMTRRIALFIDGVNLHHTAGSLGFEIDYKRLLSEFEDLALSPSVLLLVLKRERS